VIYRHTAIGGQASINNRPRKRINPTTSLASASLSTAQAQLGGATAEDWAGCSLAGADDVDADGFDDIVVGALYNDDGGSNAGAAYLVRGSGI